ncbi:hypothetical protein Tco_1500077 [Tanacetum coccineum]
MKNLCDGVVGIKIGSQQEWGRKRDLKMVRSEKDFACMEEWDGTDITKITRKEPKSDTGTERVHKRRECINYGQPSINQEKSVQALVSILNKFDFANVAEILTKFDFANVKTASTPIETQKPLVKDEEANDVDDFHLYCEKPSFHSDVLASITVIMRRTLGLTCFQVDSSDRKAVRSQMRILSVISVKNRILKNLHPMILKGYVPYINIQEMLNNAQDRYDQSSTAVNMWNKNLGDQEPCGRRTARD